jgi:hypothetical protein
MTDRVRDYFKNEDSSKRKTEIQTFLYTARKFCMHHSCFDHSHSSPIFEWSINFEYLYNKTMRCQLKKWRYN